jgi:hypothetical protein
VLLNMRDLDRKSKKSREQFSVFGFFSLDHLVSFEIEAPNCFLYFCRVPLFRNPVSLPVVIFSLDFSEYTLLWKFSSDYVYEMSSLKIISHGSVILRVTQATHSNTKRCYFLI